MEISKPNINLFIIGAAKSGTTSLYNYLQQHPNVFFPRVKEPHFYADVESNDPSAYIKPEPGKLYHEKIINDKEVYEALYNEATSEKILADASPSYLWDDKAANRIYEDYPSAKIVILLRNPTERVFSHYLMDIRSGSQTLDDFILAIERDQKAISKGWGKSHLYLELGFYSRQIERYLDLFGAQNVKIILYDDFISETKKTLKDICKYLGINEKHISAIDYNKVHNQYVAPRGKLSRFILKYKNKSSFLKRLVPFSAKSFLNGKVLLKKQKKPSLKESERLYLYDIYKEDIKKTEQILNRDLSVWKQL